LALSFLILTGSRAFNVRTATWDQFRGDEWVIPASKMKAKHQGHWVPLSTAAQAVLKEAKNALGSNAGLVFPSPTNPDEPLSDMAMAMAIRRVLGDDPALMKRAVDKSDPANPRIAVPHGFRSTLDVWCSEVGGYRREVVELLLHHKEPNKTRRAYARATHAEERREALERWGRFVTGNVGKRSRGRA
jgi:integrase